MADKKRFLTTKEAYERLGVSRTTFQEWVKDLHIQQYKGVGRTVNYAEEDVERIYREKVQIRPRGED